MKDYSSLITELRETPIDMRCARIMNDAAEAIDELQKKYDELFEAWNMYGGETGITQAFKQREVLLNALAGYRKFDGFLAAHGLFDKFMPEENK